MFEACIKICGINQAEDRITRPNLHGHARTRAHSRLSGNDQLLPCDPEFGAGPGLAFSQNHHLPDSYMK